MPSGQSFATGTQQLAVVRFRFTLLPGNSALSFSDAPVFRELVNGAAESLAMISQNGSVTSVLARPVFTKQPAGTNVLPGATVWLGAEAAGSLPIGWQWQFNGGNIPGATNAALVLSNIAVSAGGAYSVIASNVAGVTNSALAVVQVLPPPADLAVFGLTVPAQVTAGQQFNVGWSVTNLGTSAAVGPWQETVYVSDQADGSSPRAIGTVTFSGSVGANQSIVRTVTLIAPGDLSGAKYFVVLEDSGNWLPEIDENNNRAVAPSSTLVRNADLQVVRLTAPASAQQGASIAVSWAVTNSGNAAAVSVWNDRVFLSTASNSLASAAELIALSVDTNSPLAAGAAYARTANVTLPFSAQFPAGGYFLAAVADYGNAQPESNEGNNLLGTPITLTPPPLPDLLVASVTAPASAQPAQPVSLIWTVTNRGTALATGAWNETIYFTNAGSAAQALLMIQVTNALPPGGFAVRTQVVTLPFYGPAGAVWFQVETDSRNDVIEQDEANNTGTAAGSTLVPAQLTLQIPVSQIPENAPDSVIRALITRNGSRAQPLTVNFTTSDGNELAVPASVTIAANQHSASVPLTVQQDHVVDADKLVTITASAPGFASSTGSVTVLNSDVPTLGLALSAYTFPEGNTVIATVSRDYVTSDPLEVQVTSSSATLISTPTVVTIAPGLASTNFLVQTPDDNLINAPRTFFITASATGFRGATNSFTVLDNDLPAITLTLGATNVSEGAGPQATTLTVRRSPVTARSVVLEFESTNTDAALVPPQFIIPAGADAASFPVAAVNNDLVDGPKETLIRCFITDTTTGARLAEATPVLLTVQDDDGPTLKLMLAKKLVPEGLNPATTATVIRNTGTNGDLLVTVTSSRTNEATVPDSVLIPAGATSTVFSVVSINDGITDGNQSALLTASATNFTSGSDTLTVSDVNLPDLVVASITAPDAAVTETYVSVAYRIANQGVALASNFNSRIFLSRDPVVGDDVLIGQYAFAGGMGPGQFFEQALSVRLPQAAGDYWIVVQTDVNGSVREILKDNNSSVSTAPIRVRAAYEAAVSTPVTTAPPGTAIPLSGRAVLPGTSTPPAANSLVNLHLHVRGTHRVIAALTDAAGNFATTFTPLPGETGLFTVGAAHPGDADAPTQDSFTLIGFRISPVETSFTMTEQTSVTNSLLLLNGSPTPLTGLAVTVLEKPVNRMSL